MYYPFLIYFYEIRWRIFYWLFSFVLSFFVLFLYYKIILLINFYSLINYEHRRFISLNVTELFSSVLLIIFFTSCLILFDYTRFQFSLFLIPVWFCSQIKAFNFLFRFFYITFLIFYCSISLMVIPKLLIFFLSWELKNKYGLLQIVIESRLDNYLSWVVSTNFLISNVLIMLAFFIFWLTALLGILSVYKFIKRYKSQIIFLIFSSFSFLMFFDVFSQVFFFFFLLFLLELITFFISISVSCSVSK